MIAAELGDFIAQHDVEGLLASATALAELAEIGGE